MAIPPTVKYINEQLTPYRAEFLVTSEQAEPDLSSLECPSHVKRLDNSSFSPRGEEYLELFRDEVKFEKVLVLMNHWLDGGYNNVFEMIQYLQCDQTLVLDKYGNVTKGRWNYRFKRTFSKVWTGLKDAFTALRILLLLFPPRDGTTPEEKVAGKRRSNRDVTIFLNAMGPERILLNLCRKLVHRNVEVNVLLSRKRGSFLDAIPEGAKVVDLRALSLLDAVRRLALHLRDHRPDVLLSTLPLCNLSIIWARSLSGVFTRVGIMPTTNHTGISRSSNKFRFRILPVLVRVFYPLADVVLPNSRGVAEDLRHLMGEASSNLEVIPTSINREQILRRAKEIPEHPWVYKSDLPLILSAGRLIADKGFDVLIKAFQKVLNDVEARLLILGKGPRQDELESLSRACGIDSKVEFTGFVDNPFAYMNQADLFVLASRREGMPSVLLESLAVGTPVVAANCDSGPSEILEDGKYGALVPVDDPPALSRAIRRSLRDPRDPEVLRDRAKVFSMDELWSRYKEALFV